MLRRSVPILSLTRSLKLDKLQASPKDIVLAVQDGVGVYSFASYVGLTAEETADKILSIPDSNRCIHALYGREGVPIDFSADIEFPLYDNQSQSCAPYSGEGVMIDLVSAALDRLQHRKLSPQTVLLLDSHSKTKHSYHLHIRCDKALDSVDSARVIAGEVDAIVQNRGFAAIDLVPYRKGGMLRTAFSVKFTERSRALLPLVPKDPELALLVRSGNELSRRDALALSLIQRHPDTETVRVSNSRSMSFTTRNVVSAKESDKQKFFHRAVVVMRKLPDFCAEQYDYWVRIGLSLHSFNLGPAGLDQWLLFSARSRHKFDDSACRKQWEAWDRCRNEDDRDWRRGFGYLTMKLPREVRDRI